MPIQRLTLHALFIMIVLLTLGGCYTILSHPGSEESNAKIEQSADCLSCHTEYHEYPYGYYYGYYPEYWWSSPRWGHYYAYPWWWDYYWPENTGDNNDEQLAPRSSRGEKAVRRESLRPPYSSGVTSIGREGSLSSPSSTEQTPSTGTKTPTENQEKTKTEQKKEDDSDRKTPRRSGDRRQ